MNFIFNDIIYINKLSLKDKVIIILFSFLPIFLIIGTAVSELAIIILCLIFTVDFFLKKKIKIHNKNLIFFMLIIYISLIINLIFSINLGNSLLRNIFFLKYIIFTTGTINFLYKKKDELFFIIKIWSIILIIFSIDLFIQYFTQKNLIGLESPLKFHRVSGFMGEELKAGALLLPFGFIVIGYFLNNKNLNKEGLLILFSLIITIFITGDRSNFIKSIIILIFLLFFIDKYLIKRTIYLFIIALSLIFLILTTNNVFKERYNNNIFSELIKNNYNVFKFVKNTEYGKIYSSAYHLFLKKKIFGVGNKNYRVVCEKDFQKKYHLKNDTNDYKCNTHPHQIYFEILSEHGIFGIIIMFVCLGAFIYQNLMIVFKSKNALLASLFFVNLVVFTPIIPGGSFFTSFNAVIFWLNISFFYSYRNICTQK